MTDFLVPDNLDDIISMRLELTKQEKAIIKESLDSVDLKIKSALNHIIARVRPKETETELIAAINKIEHTHNTTSQTNEMERVFMYNMKKLKEKKVYLIEYNSQQAIIDELKTKKTQHLKELKDKDTTLDELYLGQRKLKTASKIGCNASDMIEHNFTVPSEKLSQIIGKAGATLLKIEMDCKVSIDTKESKQDKENKQGNVRIIGTSDTVALAVAAVLSIVSSLSLEVSAIDEKLVCLLLNKAQFAHEIESKYDVRIDISRAKKVFKVVGQPDAVHAAVKEIEDANSARIEIPIEVSILPFIVGKGGSTIKALGEGNQVHIDVEREEKLIVVIGFLENVEKSVVILKNIINENSEIEITIMADKSMIIGCIIGSGGQVIRSLQKDFSVNIRIDRDEDGKQDSVIIKGATSKAIPAKAKVMALIAEYEATTEKNQCE
mmetsp:Transcript_27330/g.26135  ORF Transcript_27330/g.26135 Transcript_27330/m.26135 type:complete len:437 (-) Transcript_27330:1-1311(-)